MLALKNAEVLGRLLLYLHGLKTAGRDLLETTVMGKQLRITPDSIAHSLRYVRPAASDRPFSLRVITDFDAQLFTEAMCTHPVPMTGFVRNEFVPGKLKPEYALMNKIIHDRIGPKGKEKSPSREQIQFLYEVMTGKLIDYALFVWCVMRDFLQFSHESMHIPFPSLVTSLVETAGMRGAAKEKRVLPRLQTKLRPRAEPHLLGLSLHSLQCLFPGSLHLQHP